MWICKSKSYKYERNIWFANVLIKPFSDRFEWINRFSPRRYPHFIPLLPVHFTLSQLSEGALRSLWWVGTQAGKWLQAIKRALLRWSTCSRIVHFFLAKCQTQLACTWHDPKSLPFCVKNLFASFSKANSIRVGRRVKAASGGAEQTGSGARRQFQFDSCTRCGGGFDSKISLEGWRATEEDRKQSDKGRKPSRWLAVWRLKQRAPRFQAASWGDTWTNTWTYSNR